MNFDIAALLTKLLPKAIAWAEQQERYVLEVGAALNPSEQALARAVGVLHPEMIRVQVVDELPFPEDPDLRDVASKYALLGPGTIGLTLGYAVLLCRGHDTRPRLLSHEFRHVYQYERLGSIQQFLPVYLQQLAEVGYDDAPLEVDARTHERDA
jgi:hypothetical protein